MTLIDGSYWVYEYDALGQVKSGKRYWSDGTPVAGQQFEYGHDTIGNRTTTAVGGDQNGSNLRSASYVVNSKNQYTSRGVPPYIEVLGIAKVDATVTVEGSPSGVYRHGEYFRKELNVNNASAAQYPTIDVDTDVTGPVSGEKFLPQHPESFTHDADGNLTQDGRWDYVWDGENRLAKMRSRSGSPAPERRIEFEYDWQGRRIRQTVWNDRDDGQGSELSDTLYLYDGWNLIAELNANSSNAKVRTYVWGLDLTGSMQGAGGVGGLLMVIDHTSATKRYFTAYDGNGNVTGLADSTTGKWSARYEYGPFGEVIRANGAASRLNPFRFSTKYQDDETDLLYYGYRYYNASTGRWLSRDPLAEQRFENSRSSGLFKLQQIIQRLVGGNLYCLANNQPISVLDVMGLGAMAPCGPGQMQVAMEEYSRMRSTLELSLFDLILPLDELPKRLQQLITGVQTYKQLKELSGEVIDSRAVFGCIPDCYVLTCRREKGIDVNFDVAANNGYSITIIMNWTHVTEYWYGLPSLYPVSCVNRNEPPDIIAR